VSSNKLLNITVQQKNIRSKAIFNYRLSRARRVAESAFGICASKWRILDKATETKVHAGVDIVKCISLLHNIIIDFEDYCCLHSRWSQHDSLSQPPTRATRKQRTNKLGRCYQPGRPFCTLTRYTLRPRTAPFTYMCLSAQASGRETRVHAGRSHAGHGLSQTDTTRDRLEAALSGNSLYKPPVYSKLPVYLCFQYYCCLETPCIFSISCLSVLPVWLL